MNRSHRLQRWRRRIHRHDFAAARGRERLRGWPPPTKTVALLGGLDHRDHVEGLQVQIQDPQTRPSELDQRQCRRLVLSRPRGANHVAEPCLPHPPRHRLMPRPPRLRRHPTPDHLHGRRTNVKTQDVRGERLTAKGLPEAFETVPPLIQLLVSGEGSGHLRPGRTFLAALPARHQRLGPKGALPDPTGRSRHIHANTAIQTSEIRTQSPRSPRRAGCSTPDSAMPTFAAPTRSAIHHNARQKPARALDVTPTKMRNRSQRAMPSAAAVRWNG